MSSDTISEAPNERRARTRKEIKQLIEERASVLSQYYNLAKHTENSGNDSSNIAELLEEFCQELVDYMATGHFEIYRRIEDGKERRGTITKLAEQIMPRINNTTQVAVAFNDTYDDIDNFNDNALELLQKHLAKLGEELAIRIDLEDQFINTLLASSEKPVLEAVTA